MNKNAILARITSASALLGLAAAALPAFAQTGALINPLNASSLTALLAELMQLVVVLGSIVLTLMIIYVGFLFVSARGNTEKVSAARTALLWTVIGGLILLGAQAITSVIAATAATL